MKIINYLFFATPLFYCQSALAEVSVDVICLSSSDKKPINMEMRIIYDDNAKWFGGMVKYQNSKKPISLVFKSRSQEMESKFTPTEHTDSWLEVFNGKITGQYEITIQGAQVPSATYENFLNKKKVFFLLNSDVDGTPEAGCAWK